MIDFKQTIINGRLTFREVSADNRLTSVYHPDVGFKTLGYYVRQYVPEDAVILSHITTDHDGIDEGYFSYSLIHYYLNRPIKYPMVYKTYTEMRREFESSIDEIDILITNTDNFDGVPEFDIKSVIYGKTLNEKKIDLIYIHSRDELALPPMRMNVDEYNQKYDKMYSYKGVNRTPLTKQEFLRR